MAIFKLTKDESFKIWYRSYYEIEADSLEKAVEMINDVDPIDSEPLDLFEQDPLETRVLDKNGKVLYAIKQL